MAKDRTPGNRGTGGPARGGGGKGRTRPPTQVVTQQRRPWGLIAAAVAVVVFAVVAIGYAVTKANESEANQITDPGEIAGIKTYDYSAGQSHVTDPVVYAESPPVGGQHEPPPNWADCTGTVYDVDIRHENAVHSLEHGAVWITYDPDKLSDADIATLSKLVDGKSGRMMSPYAGLDSAISVQSWNHQLKLDSAKDKRIAQFADFFTYNADFYPEPGASCENPDFITSPRLEADDKQAPDGTGDSSASAGSSAPATGSTVPSGSAAPSESTEPTSTSAQ